jgi:hypothetical protein
MSMPVKPWQFRQDCVPFLGIADPVLVQVPARDAVGAVSPRNSVCTWCTVIPLTSGYHECKQDTGDKMEETEFHAPGLPHFRSPLG